MWLPVGKTGNHIKSKVTDIDGAARGDRTHDLLITKSVAPVSWGSTEVYGGSTRPLLQVSFSGYVGLRGVPRVLLPGAVHVLSKGCRTMKVKLTDALAARVVLPVGVKDAVVWDADIIGFGLRIRPGGKTWILSYRPSGTGRSANTKKMKLATLSAVAKVADARKLALIALGQIARGADPLGDRAQHRAKDRVRLGELLDRYDANLERRQYVNRKSVMSALRGKPAALLSRDVTTITGAEYAKIIEGIRAKGLTGAADMFRTLCRAFLTWCVSDAKLLAVNPLAGHRKERATRADKVSKVMKGRALSDAELLRIWRAADPRTTIGRLIRFLILTGCRRGEGAGVTWQMVDDVNGVLDLPAIFTKQGRGHKAPIAPQLRAILDLCERDARSELVFPVGEDGEGDERVDEARGRNAQSVWRRFRPTRSPSHLPNRSLQAGCRCRHRGTIHRARPRGSRGDLQSGRCDPEDAPRLRGLGGSRHRLGRRLA